ncbi:MAG: hypothetical protein AAF654_01920 [Myxococcota bacterium]
MHSDLPSRVQRQPTVTLAGSDEPGTRDVTAASGDEGGWTPKAKMQKATNWLVENPGKAACGAVGLGVGMLVSSKVHGMLGGYTFQVGCFPVHINASILADRVFGNAAVGEPARMLVSLLSGMATAYVTRKTIGGAVHGLNRAGTALLSAMAEQAHELAMVERQLVRHTQRT